MATAKKIQDMLKAIGEKTPDSVKQKIEAFSDAPTDEDAEAAKEDAVDDCKSYPELPLQMEVEAWSL
jgi:hypothetical protein